MNRTTASEGTVMQDRSTVDRTSDRELVVERTIRGPSRIVFDAWTKPELFQRWWVPRSFPISLLSCELDVRVGGRYRLVFAHEDSTMEFFGRYLEVTPPSLLAWTNDEGDDGGPITTVTFEDLGARTRVVVHDLYPSKEALDDAIASGSAGINAMPESLEQLEELLLTLDTSAGGS
jgi:uncharacterized protein YndB with AHSA1/START domain